VSIEGLPSRSEFIAALKARDGWLYALAFWLFAYLLFTFSRSLRADLPPAYLSEMRLVITGTGALIYRLVIAFMAAGQGRRPILLIGMALVIPAAAIILVLRLVFEGWIGRELLIVADHVRWSIIWAGYFGAWIGIYAIMWATQDRSEPEAADAQPDTEPDALWLGQRGRIERVQVNSIRWIEAEGNYVRIHADDSTGLIRMSMTRMEDRLKPAGFRRVHRSALCRPADITSIVRRTSGAFGGLLASGDEVPVSREMATQLRQADLVREEN
jgi:hypothetical protein